MSSSLSTTSKVPDSEKKISTCHTRFEQKKNNPQFTGPTTLAAIDQNVSASGVSPSGIGYDLSTLERPADINGDKGLKISYRTHFVKNEIVIDE